MTIAAYVGVPGDCKTYSLAHWILGEQPKRTTVTNFAIHGSLKLEYLADLFHGTRAGAAVGIDEIARILPARDWSAEDAMESALFELHRHLGLDIRYTEQDVAQGSVALRRLTEWFIFCYRIGPDPSVKLKRIETGKRKVPLHWWECPIAVKQLWVHREDMGSDGKPKAADKRLESKVRYIWWSRGKAKQYDTTERLLYQGLQEEIDAHLIQASERLSIEEPWAVIDGHALGTLSRLYRQRDLQKQRTEALRAEKKGNGRADANLSTVNLAELQGGTPEQIAEARRIARGES